MCKYCTIPRDDYLVSEKGFEIDILNMGDRTILDIYYYGKEEKSDTEVYINYCPMCGRKL